MKKLTVGLIGIAFVIMFSSNAWAQSGLRIDLGGNGFGFSVSDGYSGLSTYSYNNYRPYPYYSGYYPNQYYYGYYPNRPYRGWGGYSGHRHHNHKQWGHHRSGRHHKGHYYGNQRGYKRDGYGQRRGNHHRQGRSGRQWRR